MSQVGLEPVVSVAQLVSALAHVWLVLLNVFLEGRWFESSLRHFSCFKTVNIYYQFRVQKRQPLFNLKSLRLTNIRRCKACIPTLVVCNTVRVESVMLPRAAWLTCALY